MGLFGDFFGVGDEFSDGTEVGGGDVGVFEGVGSLVADGGETQGAVAEDFLHNAVLAEAGILDGTEVDGVD